MADNKMKPLCVRTDSRPTRYICVATGNDCKIATDYFRNLHDTIKQSVKDGRVFITKESNLCAENDCPIWNNVILKINEFAVNIILL